MQLPNLLELSVPVVFALVLCEIAFVRYTMRGHYEVRDTAATLFLAFTAIFVGAALSGPFAAFNQFVLKHRLIALDRSWLSFFVAFLLVDMSFYWWHRANHRVRLLWADHVQHHSSQHFNLTTALRVSATGSVVYSLFFYVPMLLIGFPLELLLFSRGINIVYQFWVHTEAIDRMPAWFEAIFNTPSHHRVHHATNARYLDANYAGVLIVWDRMFGTFVAETALDPPRYGLVKGIGTFNPLKVALHEWISMFGALRRARSVREACGSVFGPPGWLANGDHETSETIKARWRDAATAAAE